MNIQPTLTCPNCGQPHPATRLADGHYQIQCAANGLRYVYHEAPSLMYGMVRSQWFWVAQGAIITACPTCGRTMQLAEAVAMSPFASPAVQNAAAFVFVCAAVVGFALVLAAASRPGGPGRLAKGALNG